MFSRIVFKHIIWMLYISFVFIYFRLCLSVTSFCTLRSLIICKEVSGPKYWQLYYYYYYYYYYRKEVYLLMMYSPPRDASTCEGDFSTPRLSGIKWQMSHCLLFIIKGGNLLWPFAFPFHSYFYGWIGCPYKSDVALPTSRTQSFETASTKVLYQSLS
jgi:hypothetical protein